MAAAKGVRVTHTALHMQSLAKLAVVGYCNSDVYLHVTPLFHIGTCWALEYHAPICSWGSLQAFEGCLRSTACSLQPETTLHDQ